MAAPTDARPTFDVVLFFPLLADLLKDDTFFPRDRVRFDGIQQYDKEFYWQYTKIEKDDDWKPKTEEEAKGLEMYYSFGQCDVICKLAHHILRAIFFNMAASHILCYDGQPVTSIKIFHAVVTASQVPNFSSSIVTHTPADEGKDQDWDSDLNTRLFNKHEVLLLSLADGREFTVDFTATQYGLFSPTDTMPVRYVTISQVKHGKTDYLVLMAQAEEINVNSWWTASCYQYLRLRTANLSTFLDYFGNKATVMDPRCVEIIWNAKYVDFHSPSDLTVIMKGRNSRGTVIVAHAELPDSLLCYQIITFTFVSNDTTPIVVLSSN